jgi:hypothetical protein
LPPEQGEAGFERPASLAEGERPQPQPSASLAEGERPQPQPAPVAAAAPSADDLIAAAAALGADEPVLAEAATPAADQPVPVAAAAPSADEPVPVAAAALRADEPTKPATVSQADLARASVKKKTEGTKDIALESLAVASQARAQVDEIAERVKARTQQGTGDEAPRQVAEKPGVPAPQVQASRGPWIVTGFAVLAAAAAIAISQRPKTEPPALAVSQEVSPQKSPAQAPTLADRAPSPAPAAEPTGQAISQLPPAEAARAPLAHPPARPGAAPSPAPADSGVTPEAITLEDEEPAPPPPAAAPAPSAKMVPAAGLPPGGLPDKPSAGAAYAAIGPFMGSARACVAGHDEPSTARIVFSSDGTVQNVSVSGPAAGTPAAACIENALKKARVQPFASPTFSMSAPIRPQ